ncbi:MAG: shikimate dehydrogenase [Planctomycetes bacterium]|nr:shikimate dehydrogenase [Planctomycetota bacterium]
MICASLTSPTMQTALADMKKACEAADIVEIRLDYIDSPAVKPFVENRTKPIIATNRPTREGGKYEGDEKKRIALLREAAAAGFDYIDIELDSVERLGEHGASKVIVSYHNFKQMPDNLREIHEQIVAAGADIAKLAVMATDICDTLRMFDLLRDVSIPTIGLCMGEEGVITRILGPRFGSFLSFGTLAEGKQSAPGQIPIRDMRGLYRVNDLDAETKLYGVIANPVAHSMSPAIHNAAFQEKGINAVYLPLKVADVRRFVAEFKKLDMQGYSVTIPHKVDVIDVMDEVDEFVSDIGAMNTVVNRDGRLCGYNTDCLGALRAIENVMGGEEPLKGKRVVMLGAGGTSRAIGYGIKARGGKLTILNRTVSKAEKLAGEIGCEWGPLDRLTEIEFDVLLNTTSVGMHPNVDDTPAPTDVLKEGMIVFDAVYNPMETRLLREATERGCVTVSGVDMFVNQAVAQFEMWTETDAPVERMRQVVVERLKVR